MSGESAACPTSCSRLTEPAKSLRLKHVGRLHPPPNNQEPGPLGAPSHSAALIGQFYAERNREYPLRVPVMSLGRARANSLRISDDRVAAHHVRIERQHDARFVLEVTAHDAQTAVNGAPLVAGERRSLTNGDLITLAGLAFRFSSHEAAAALGRVWVVRGVHRGKVFRIDSPEVVIGRATEAHVQFPDRSVSRQHCKIRESGGTWWIEDLNSTNGTLLNGSPLQRATSLRHGDEVAAGFSRFVFQEADRPLPNLRSAPLPPRN